MDRESNVLIPQVSVVLDAGVSVSPDWELGQVENAASMAVTVSMCDKVTFKPEHMNQFRFYSYCIATRKGSPCEIGTELVHSDAAPAAIGGTPVPSLTPALYNAIFFPTGKRIGSFAVGGPRFELFLIYSKLFWKCGACAQPCGVAVESDLGQELRWLRLWVPISGRGLEKGHSLSAGMTRAPKSCYRNGLLKSRIFKIESC